MLGWNAGTLDSREIFSYLIRIDAPFARVDDLIDAIETGLVTYARDALIQEVWKAVRDDIVYIPLHQQVIVWAMRDQLELPVDSWNFPRFRLARLNPAQPGSPTRPDTAKATTAQ
jgi:peptide/nickel transport system substrate-binding protein